MADDQSLAEIMEEKRKKTAEYYKVVKLHTRRNQQLKILSLSDGGYVRVNESNNETARSVVNRGLGNDLIA